MKMVKYNQIMTIDDQGNPINNKIVNKTLYDDWKQAIENI